MCKACLCTCLKTIAIHSQLHTRNCERNLSQLTRIFILSFTTCDFYFCIKNNSHSKMNVKLLGLYNDLNGVSVIQNVDSRWTGEY